MFNNGKSGVESHISSMFSFWLMIMIVIMKMMMLPLIVVMIMMMMTFETLAGKLVPLSPVLQIPWHALGQVGRSSR